MTLTAWFWHFLSNSFKKNPLSLLILGQKSCFLGPPIFETPQLNWYQVFTINGNFIYFLSIRWKLFSKHAWISQCKINFTFIFRRLILCTTRLLDRKEKQNSLFFLLFLQKFMDNAHVFAIKSAMQNRLKSVYSVSRQKKGKAKRKKQKMLNTNGLRALHA